MLPILKKTTPNIITRNVGWFEDYLLKEK